MNTVATTQPRSFRDLITSEKYKGELQKALPTGVSVDRVAKIVLSALNRTPALLECTALSTYQATVECATLNLWPGPLGHVYLVSRNNKIRDPNGERWEKQLQAMVGFRGMMELAYRSGLVRPGSFAAMPVYEGDHFEYEHGSTPYLKHKPAIQKRGSVIAFYAICTPAGDGAVPIFHVMPKEDIDAIKARSSSKDRNGNVVGPWVTDYNEMGCKTVVRRLWKYLPSSITERFADVIERDQEREFDFAKEVNGTVVPDSKPAKMRGGEDAEPSYDEEPPIQVDHGDDAGEPLTVENVTNRIEEIIAEIGDERGTELAKAINAEFKVKSVKGLGAAQIPVYLDRLNEAFGEVKAEAK